MQEQAEQGKQKGKSMTKTENTNNASGFNSRLIAREELARILNVSVTTLLRERKKLESVLPMVKINDRVIRYKMSDVQRFIENGGLT